MASTPGIPLRMIACTDRLRAANFTVARGGNATGDQVAVFIRNADGGGFRNLATFLVEDGGLRLIALNGNVRLYRANRIANGAGMLAQGALIPFSNAAGAAGARTDLLTLRFPDDPESSFASCMQLGLDINRSSGSGSTSFVFTDLTMMRLEQEGDAERSGIGLLGGLDGGFPTSAPCLTACLPCPVGSLAVVSAASYNALSVAPDSIAAAFGSGLANITLSAAQSPLPTDLGGVTVKVRDSNGDERLAQLFFVSPNQINYLVPPETAHGPATVIVNDGDGRLSIGSILINPVEPGLFSASSNGQDLAAAYVVRVKPDGSQIIENVARFDAALSRFVAEPINFGSQGDSLYLVLFGTGFRNYQNPADLSVRIGGIPMVVSAAGPQGTFLGLDQLNVLLSSELVGAGAVNIEFRVAGKMSNVVTVAFN
jgi:uncharacterized protein (TIGR03437 family)